MITHILVGIDGSEGSSRAAFFARDLASQTGARLTMLVAIQPPSAVPLPPFDAFSITRAHPDPEHLAAARVVMDAIEAELGDQSTADVGFGAPAETLVNKARELEVDLLVVGARGIGGAARLLLGSVSEAVLKDAGRPVLVVP